LEDFGNISHVLETTVLLRDTLSNGPLVQEDWHIVVAAEFDSPFVKVLQIPVVVKLHHGISTFVATWAVFFNPSRVQSLAFVGATVLSNGRSSKSPIVWDKVVKSVDDVVHIWQDHIVGESPEFVIISASNHARSSGISFLDRSTHLGVEFSDLLGVG
jgi:hypothetical protein